MSLKILALDTSTEACSTALLYNHEYIGRYQLAPRQHTQLILPMIQALLAEADLKLDQLDAI
ncbi:MAG: tRNA (adenosine(37)-N6)-threonylcarbamoyltransferase complex dimerization subunit type 1 TsaB, partial [Alphaproteobacteria bacterium]|nr:tRNA (adenosine(37)-N6)-threonylcarbamoyltransferase complex dimerization subunit type 1 TsaB [Alphaproteobacteria bacterium]